VPLYLNPYVLGGGALVLIGGLVLLMRRKKPSLDDVAEPTSRRISDDVALRASFAKTQVGMAVPASAAPPVLPVAPIAEPVVAAPPADAELDARLAAIAARPQDLEAHLNLLRLFHGRGDAADYESAAQAMRLQVPSTMDPRWREAVIMGASLMPGHPLFSQAGWNASRVEPESVRVPAPAPVEDDEDLSFADVDGDGGAAADYSDSSNQAIPAATGVADDDASATRIELAKAYLDIGDLEGARSMLEEVLVEGGPSARATAEQILREIG